MNEFIALSIAVIISALLAIIFILLNYLFAPKGSKSNLKLSPFECGEEVIGEAHIRMNVQYYIYGIAYLITDIFAVILIIWAITSTQTGIIGIFSFIFFSLLILIGLAYVIKKGMLRWV